MNHVDQGERVPDDQHRQDYVKRTNYIVSNLHEIGPIARIIIFFIFLGVLVYVVEVHIEEVIYTDKHGPRKHDILHPLSFLDKIFFVQLQFVCFEIKLDDVLQIKDTGLICDSNDDF